MKPTSPSYQLTLQEAKTLKHQMEENITKAIYVFEEQTGLKVDRVEVVRLIPVNALTFDDSPLEKVKTRVLFKD